MGIERGLLDKMVSGAFMGKREIGRPLKYNTRNRGKHGYVVNSISILYLIFFSIRQQMD